MVYTWKFKVYNLYMSMKVLHVECGGGGQNVHYQELLQGLSYDVPAKPTNLQLVIHTDSYPNQAFAEISVWTEQGWKRVHRLSGRGMETDLNLGYKHDVNFSDITKLAPFIQADRKTLLDLAWIVLRLRK